MRTGNVAPGEIIFAKKYENEKHSSFSEVCHLFMKEANLNGRVPLACVLACAGPIMNNTVEFTNIKFGWKINGPGLERELGIKEVKLINDFAAMGYGLLTLKPHEYIVLNDAPREEGAPIATIGAGTGLGECYLTAGNDGKYSCFSCEGGHSDFAPTDDLEIELYNYIKNKVRWHCISDRSLMAHQVDSHDYFAATAWLPQALLGRAYCQRPWPGHDLRIPVQEVPGEGERHDPGRV